MPRIPKESKSDCSPVVELENFENDLMALNKYWCSEEIKKQIAVKLKSMIRGNTDCFTHFNVNPLYKKGSHGHYRVVIYMRDYDWEGFLPASKIYRDYSVEVDLKDCRICNTDPPLVSKI